MKKLIEFNDNMNNPAWEKFKEVQKEYEEAEKQLQEERIRKEQEKKAKELEERQKADDTAWFNGKQGLVNQLLSFLGKDTNPKIAWLIIALLDSKNNQYYTREGYLVGGENNINGASFLGNVEHIKRVLETNSNNPEVKKK